MPFIFSRLPPWNQWRNSWKWPRWAGRLRKFSSQFPLYCLTRGWGLLPTHKELEGRSVPENFFWDIRKQCDTRSCPAGCYPSGVGLGGFTAHKGSVQKVNTDSFHINFAVEPLRRWWGMMCVLSCPNQGLHLSPFVCGGRVATSERSWERRR